MKICDRKDCRRYYLMFRDGCAADDFPADLCVKHGFSFFELKRPKLGIGRSDLFSVMIEDTFAPKRHQAEIRVGLPERSIKHGDVLKEAHEAINGPRQDSYGDPKTSFTGIAHRWSRYLQNKGLIDRWISASDVAVMMVEFKLERELNKPKRDNIRDACGYLAIYADILKDGEE